MKRGDMAKMHVSRRDFLKSAGIGGAAAAGALVFTKTIPSFAEETPVTTEARTSPYTAALGDEVHLLPMRMAECPGPTGPIAFEDREIAESELRSTEECDVLIIGAGIGGLMGTLKAAEEGANVITLEKMTEGRSAWESFGAVGAKFQIEEGIDIDPAELRDEIYRAADWRVDPGPIESYVARSGEMADFWQEMLDKGGAGWELYKFDQAPNYNGFPVIDSYVNFRMPEGISKTWLFGIYVCKELQKVAESYANVQFRYETPAVQLIREPSGRVSGCIAKSGDDYIKFIASKGVLLATGGYDANPEMMQTWVRPEDYESSAWWNPGWGTTGDGHMMGLKVGASMDSLPHPVMNFSNATPGTFVEKRVYFPGAMNYSIIVNSDCQRFVNENGARQYISNAINVQYRQGKKCYHIFDQAMIAGTLEKVPNASKQFDLDEEKGFLFRADSLSELAKMIDLDPEALEATVDRYNSFLLEGLEREPDYYRYTGNTIPFSGGTYYALLTNSVILATVGGLSINGDAQVLDTDSKPIEGLYATGNASGNFYSGNYPRHIPGTSVGRAATLAYIAAEHMLKGGQS